jgi:pterin-4a-carbinolamine dehydratase
VLRLAPRIAPIKLAIFRWSVVTDRLAGRSTAASDVAGTRSSTTRARSAGATAGRTRPGPRSASPSTGVRNGRTVTVRDRDSMEQVRVGVDRLENGWPNGCKEEGMMELTKRHCVACSGDTRRSRRKRSSGCTSDSRLGRDVGKEARERGSNSGFHEGHGFVNRVALSRKRKATTEHITIDYRRVTFTIWTHAIDDLSEATSSWPRRSTSCTGKESPSRPIAPPRSDWVGLLPSGARLRPQPLAGLSVRRFRCGTSGWSDGAEARCRAPAGLAGRAG